MNFYENIDPQALNAAFIEKLGSREGIEDLERLSAAFTRSRLRELGFLRRVIPPEYVHPDDLQRSLNHESFEKIVDIEPDSQAMTINWRGDSDGQYVTGQRAALVFGTVSSKRFSKKISELRTYEMPITKIIEDNTVRDIQEQEDIRFIRQVERIVLDNTTGTKLMQFQDTWPDGEVRTQLDRVAITQTAKLLHSSERRATTLLMSLADMDDLVGLDAAIIGDDLAGRLTVDGWEKKNLFGYRVIPSVKAVSRAGLTFNDGAVGDQVSLTIQGLAPMEVGRFWFFTDPEYLGKFYILEESNFFIKREWGTVMWQQTEEIAAGVTNTGSMAGADLRLGTPGTAGWRASTGTAVNQPFDTTLI